MTRQLVLILVAACSTPHGSITADAQGDDAAPELDAPAIDAFVPDAGPSSSRMTKRPLGTTDAAQGFWEYLPPGYGGGAAPLLVALHGIGENGDGSDAALDAPGNIGIARLIRQDKWPNERPFVVLAPQHPGSGCPSGNEIHDFIAFAMTHYQIDPARVYLTGLSCGAIGSWQYLDGYLDAQIAALVPIAGDGRSAWSHRGCELGKVAIWAFHGDPDPTVPTDGSTIPMAGLAQCPSPPRKDAQLILYPGVGHSGWEQTYDLSAGHDIYTWLLAQHK